MLRAKRVAFLTVGCGACSFIVMPQRFGVERQSLQVFVPYPFPNGREVNALTDFVGDVGVTESVALYVWDPSQISNS